VTAVEFTLLCAKLFLPSEIRHFCEINAYGEVRLFMKLTAVFMAVIRWNYCFLSVKNKYILAIGEQHHVLDKMS
jgi:hypothetical protein